MLEALQRNGWNVTRAAADVGIQRPNFQMLMRRHGIKGGQGAEHDGPGSPVGEMSDVSEVEYNSDYSALYILPGWLHTSRIQCLIRRPAPDGISDITKFPSVLLIDRRQLGSDERRVGA